MNFLRSSNLFFFLSYLICFTLVEASPFKDYDIEKKNYCLEILNEQVREEYQRRLPIKNYQDFLEKLQTGTEGVDVFNQFPHALDPLTKITLRKKLFLKDEVNFGANTGFTTAAGSGRANIYSWDSGYTLYPETEDDIQLLSISDPEKDDTKTFIWCRNQHQSTLDPTFSLLDIIDTTRGVVDGPTLIKVKQVTKNGKNFKVITLVRRVHWAKYKDYFMQEEEIYVLPETRGNDFFNIYDRVEDYAYLSEWVLERARVIMEGPGWNTWEGNENIKYNMAHNMVSYFGVLSNADQVIRTAMELTLLLIADKNRIEKYATRGVSRYYYSIKDKVEFLNYAYRITEEKEEVPFEVYSLNRFEAKGFTGKEKLISCGVDESVAQEYEKAVNDLNKKYDVTQETLLEKGEEVINAYINERFDLEALHRDLMIPCKKAEFEEEKQQRKAWLAKPMSQRIVDYSYLEAYLQSMAKLPPKKEEHIFTPEILDQLTRLTLAFQEESKQLYELADETQMPAADFNKQIEALHNKFTIRQNTILEKRKQEKLEKEKNTKKGFWKVFLSVFTVTFVLVFVLLMILFKKKKEE